jgi:hypothetical protein
MIHNALAAPYWSTSAIGHAAITLPHEMSALREHLYLCRTLSGRYFGLRCRAEAIHEFVAARFVTTLVAISLLVGTGLLV